MTDMREKFARDICITDGEDPDEQVSLTWDIKVPKWKTYEPHADAVLATIGKALMVGEVIERQPAHFQQKALLQQIMTICDIGSAEEFDDAVERLSAIKGLLERANIEGGKEE